MTTTLSFLLYSRPKPHTWYMPRDPQVFLLTISLPFSQYSTPALFSATTRTTWDRFSCVTFSNLRHPRDFTSPTSRKGILYIYIYKCVFLALQHFFLFRPRVLPRALGSVERREPARTPHASLGPGRGPWHVLWGFEVESPLGEGFRARRAIQVYANPRT